MEAGLNVAASTTWGTELQGSYAWWLQAGLSAVVVLLNVYIGLTVRAAGRQQAGPARAPSPPDNVGGRCTPPVRPRLLVVTAHPDDEAMFFGPSLLQLRQNYDVYLLCLSCGDYAGHGAVRRQELLASCRRLSIPASHVTVVDSPTLPDDPTVNWPFAEISALVSSQAQRVEAARILTFDAYGVSGHKNHMATHAGVALALGQLGPCVQGFELVSIGVARKYLGVVDALASGLANNVAFVNFDSFFTLQGALQEHRSQLVWFRQLYRLFSRYMYMNTLRPISTAAVPPNIL